MNIAEMMSMLNPQAIQARMEELKRKTSAISATGSAGGGMVKVTLNGNLDMLACEIAPEVVDPAELALLQDLVRAAYNDASSKVREELQREISSGFEGMSLPPGMLGGLG